MSQTLHVVISPRVGICRGECGCHADEDPGLPLTTVQVVGMHACMGRGHGHCQPLSLSCVCWCELVCLSWRRWREHRWQWHSHNAWSAVPSFRIPHPDLTWGMMFWTAEGGLHTRGRWALSQYSERDSECSGKKRVSSLRPLRTCHCWWSQDTTHHPCWF